MKRVWQIAAIVMIMITIFTYNNSAYAEGLTMEAEVGFDGTYMMDKWTPVKVKLENTGSNIEGNLEALVHNESGRSVIYSVPVSIPNTSSKEYTLYVKLQGLVRTLDIKLVDKKSKIIKEIKVKDLNPITRDKYMLGLLTDDSPSLGYWKERMDGNLILSNYQPISLTTETLSDRKEVIDNFSFIIINNIDSSRLTEGQVSALNSWVDDGGILILGTGVNGRRTLSGLAPKLLDVQQGEVTDISDTSALEGMSGRPILGETPLSIMDLKIEKADSVLKQNEKDLVRLLKKGSGRIYISTFDIGTEPILSWAGNKMLWENLLSQTLPQTMISAFRNPYIGYSEIGNIEEVLSYIKAMDFPSTFLILFIFLIYLAMAGPLNYIILKKIDKRELSWFTIPALSIIFAAAIYGLGFSAKGGELIMNTVSIVEMNTDSGADLTNYAGIFIPKRGDYSVKVDRNVLLSLNSRDYYGPYPGEINDRGIVEAKISQGIPSEILFNDVNIWTMKTFQMDQRHVDYGSINGDLFYNDGSIKGTISNNTKYPLEDLVLLTPDSYAKVGNIAAGETKSIDVALPTQIQSPYYYNIYYSMLEDLYPYPAGVAQGGDKERERLARRRLIEILYTNNNYATKEGVTKDFALEYFAFYQGDLTEGILVNDKKPDVSISRGIIKGSFELAVEKDGYISIPTGLLKGKLERDMSKNADSGSDVAFLRDFRDYAVYSINLSPYLELDELKMQIMTNIQYGQGSTLIYDLEQQEYVKVVDKNINISQNDLFRYVDVDGNIYIKFQPDIDQMIEVSAPSVTLEGRKK